MTPKQFTWTSWLLAGFAGLSLQAQTATNSLLKEPAIPLWDESVSLRSGFGYKDNVTLSSSNPRGSAFWKAGGDLLLFRLPTHGWLFNLFASVDNAGYLDHSTGVNNEQFAVIAAQLTKDLGHGWRLGGGLNYTYQDQVFDTSTQQTNNFPIGEVRGHILGQRLTARKEWGRYWCEGELSLARQWFAAPLDNSWQTGPRLTLGRSVGQASQVTLSYQWTHVLFDTREIVDRAGAPVPGTHLRFDPQVAEVAWQHFWDGKRHWDTTLKAGLEFNQDNGSGYFDYHQYHLSQQLKYHAQTWELSGQVRLGYYGFPNQPLSATDSSMRQQTVLSFGLHAEKRLGKRCKLFADYSFDDSFANTPENNYQANTTSAGFEWQF